jgi:hypothetical protein
MKCPPSANPGLNTEPADSNGLTGSFDGHSYATVFPPLPRQGLMVSIGPFTPRQAERTFGIDRAALTKARRTRAFPPYILVGGCILYLRADLERMVRDQGPILAGNRAIRVP